MRLLSLIAVVLAVASWRPLPVRGAEAPSGKARPAVRAESEAQETLRSYLQLQEQVHEAQLAIEQTRRENAETAARDTDTLSNRLQAIQAALSTQRARELESMQNSNRVMLIIAGTFACAGVAAMLLMASFLWRTVRGLAGISASLSSGRLPGSASETGQLEMAPGTAGQVEQLNSRLINALEQLDKRIYHLENATRQALSARLSESTGSTTAHRSNGNGAGAEAASSASAQGQSASEQEEQCQQLLVNGQALLDQDMPERALECFEQALVLDPRHGEALVKKGVALERLQRLDEAVLCYDQAIEADTSLTSAYLHKGGLFNRMERFTEALQCYEKALRTQEKREDNPRNSPEK